MTIDYPHLYIGGSWVTPSTDARIEVRSPTTTQLIGSTPEALERDVDAAVDAARAAFDASDGWSRWSPERRREVIELFATEVESRKDEVARRVSMQNGMPIWLSEQWEAAAPPGLLRYYAGLAVDTPQEELRPSVIGRGGTRIVRRPIGVVAAIVPWNSPQSLSAMKLAPALAAGCTVVLKPAPETVLDAQLLAESALAAGMPPGVVNIVPGGREVGGYLVSHPGVDKVAFTGSTTAGRAIAEACGRLFRPVTLEMGGKSAAILLDDVDLETHLESLFAATLLNSGQICYLGTRVLAPRSRYDEVVDAVTGLASSLTVGDPLDSSTQLGPLVSARQRDRVESYIAKGLSDGARLTTGGGRPADVGPGWFVEPTVFADVDNAQTIAQEEIFGPVLSVIPYADDDEAVRIANASDYGLGGSVWTADPERGERVARRIETGTIGINGYIVEVNAPFGGVKASGIGRELGPESLASYQQLQSIYLAGQD